MCIIEQNMEEILKNISNLKWNEKMRFLRKYHRINKSKMAAICCTYRANYHGWEKGYVYPRKYNRNIIAKALNVRVSDIFPI